MKSTNIKLGWIRAHVGYSGNEAADVLAKKATREGIPTYIPAPRNHIKSLLQKESIIRWQKEWDNGETGRSVHNVLPKVKTTPTPGQRPEIMFVTGHGPFPTYLKRFNIRSSDSCGCGNLGNPLHYATTQLKKIFKKKICSKYLQIFLQVSLIINCIYESTYLYDVECDETSSSCLGFEPAIL
ncbi:hypothetical protein AVEN_255447-1 [Araneus ventricosus]|uniref:RNase H type-1 domain-containing protein n=1 Tax=Araneus ventricosus TaxID=182803 RepID=A0A4Y2TMH9_ARAVE|nr:hypothetical protein AVEN_255447-1 [Araneus ventricosus]